ncbi:signal peptidase I [bacterium]|nr:signal peptidase I [bacterium]
MRAKRLVKQARILLRNRAKRLTPEGKKEIEERIEELERAISRGAKKQVEKSAAALEKAVARHIRKTKLQVVGEWAYSLTTAALIALVIRHFAVEPFKIPSGSMIPTLKIGDKILVSKFVYGLRIPFAGIRLPMGSKPKRWDVIVFSTRGIYDACQFPKNFVKRVVGLPGETLEIRDGKIYKYIPDGNGGEKATPVDRPEYVAEILYENIEEGRRVRIEEWDYVKILGIRLWKKGFPRQSVRGYWPYGIKGKKFTVPEGCYFALGDNTSKSFDGRGWGFVPFENIRGKVMCKWSFKPPFGQGVVR